MLEGLDAIDWSSLTHAHGPATDVPELLRSLLSEDPDVRLQALAELVEKIWHQGTVYPASAAAIPFLFELLTHPDVHDPGWRRLRGGLHRDRRGLASVRASRRRRADVAKETRQAAADRLRRRWRRSAR